MQTTQRKYNSATTILLLSRYTSQYTISEPKLCELNCHANNLVLQKDPTWQHKIKSKVKKTKTKVKIKVE